MRGWATDDADETRIFTDIGKDAIRENLCLIRVIRGPSPLFLKHSPKIQNWHDSFCHNCILAQHLLTYNLLNLISSNR